MSNYKALLFDYGGTIDTAGCHWNKVIYDAYCSVGMTVDYEAFRHAYVMGERYLEHAGCILPTDTMLDLLRKKIEHQFQVLGLAEGAEAVAVECYNKVRAITADAAQVLEVLSQRCPLVMVSNFYGNLRTVLEDFGLLHYFAHIVESATEGVRKPDPEIWRRGLVLTGFEAKDVMAVGDSFSKDIMPARSLGCQTAWVKGIEWEPRQHDETIPTRIIYNIRELL